MTNRDRINYSSSLDERQKYFQSLNKHYGTHHPSFLAGLNNLALLYKKSNDLPNSLLISEKSAQGYANLFGETHPSTVITKQNYAGTLRQAGRVQEAILILEEILSIYREDQ